LTLNQNCLNNLLVTVAGFLFFSGNFRSSLTVIIKVTTLLLLITDCQKATLCRLPEWFLHARSKQHSRVKHSRFSNGSERMRITLQRKDHHHEAECSGLLCSFYLECTEISGLS